MPLPCTFKLLAAQMFVGLVAACAILGIKFTTVPGNSKLLKVDNKGVVSQSQGWLDAIVARRTAEVPTEAPDPSLEEHMSQVTAVAARSATVGPIKVPPEEVPYQHKHAVYKRAHRYGDLPGLRPDRSPDSEEWDNSIAICACMFGENTTDVREWILYNRWLGVDHIYLTENGPQDGPPPPETLIEEIQEFVDDGFVTYKSDPRPSFQQIIYVDCMTQHRHKHNWMAFIDLDEYIVLRNKDVPLKAFLDDYKHDPALVMHWVIVGPSHQEGRPQEGGVLRTYRECQTQPSPVVKSITNTFFLANMASNPHTFEFRDNKPSVDEHKRPMPWRYPIPEACQDGTIHDAARNLDCRPLSHVQKRPASVDSIALFHYITKSSEDFERKVKRGGGGGTHRTWEHFNRIQQDASGTGGICDEAFSVADECCKLKEYTSSSKKLAGTSRGKHHRSPRRRLPKAKKNSIS